MRIYEPPFEPWRSFPITRTLLPEDENGITNFSPEDRPLYEAALKEWGKDGLFISDKPFGKPCMPQDLSLRFTGQHFDLSDFYKIFWRLEKKTPMHFKSKFPKGSFD